MMSLQGVRINLRSKCFTLLNTNKDHYCVSIISILQSNHRKGSRCLISWLQKSEHLKLFIWWNSLSLVFYLNRIDISQAKYRILQTATDWALFPELKKKTIIDTFTFLKSVCVHCMHFCNQEYGKLVFLYINMYNEPCPHYTVYQYIFS